MKDSEPGIDFQRLAAAGVLLERDPASIEAVSRDAGGLVAATPQAVVSPEDAAQVSAVLRQAGEEGWAVAIRGAGRSCGGQSLAGAPVIVDLGRLQSVDRPKGGSVWAGAGATWGQLVERLAPSALPLPLPPADGSVGGSESVAALGRGACGVSVAARCLEAEVVTASGDIVRCGPDENAELFDCLRGGLGQFGVLTRLCLNLQAVPERLSLTWLACDDFDGLLEVLLHAARYQPLHAEGRCVPARLGRRIVAGASLPVVSWQYVAEVCLAADSDLAGLPGRPLHTQEVALEEWLRPPPWLLPQPEVAGSVSGLLPQIDWLLPLTSGASVVGGLLGGLPPELLADGCLRFQVRRPDPLPLLVQPESDPVLWVALRCRVPRASAASLLPLLQRIARLGQDAGGFRHPGGWLPFEASDWRRHFGAHWERLRRAKSFYDPQGLLNPGVIPLIAQEKPTA